MPPEHIAPSGTSAISRRRHRGAQLRRHPSELPCGAGRGQRRGALAVDRGGRVIPAPRLGPGERGEVDLEQRPRGAGGRSLQAASAGRCAQP